MGKENKHAMWVKHVDLDYVLNTHFWTNSREPGEERPKERMGRCFHLVFQYKTPTQCLNSYVLFDRHLAWMSKIFGRGKPKKLAHDSDDDVDDDGRPLAMVPSCRVLDELILGVYQFISFCCLVTKLRQKAMEVSILFVVFALILILAFELCCKA